MVQQGKLLCVGEYNESLSYPGRYHYADTPSHTHARVCMYTRIYYLMLCLLHVHTCVAVVQIRKSSFQRKNFHQKAHFLI